MKRLSLLLSFCFTTILLFSQSNTYFLSNPTLTPDGQTVIFAYEGDLWKANINDGNATRLTAMQGYETSPRVSPDGKWIAFISFPNTIQPNDHPALKRVMLRLMPVSGGAPRVLTYLYGGQGTINVPSWSPDSQRIAFVSYIGRE